MLRIATFYMVSSPVGESLSSPCCFQLEFGIFRKDSDTSSSYFADIYCNSPRLNLITSAERLPSAYDEL